MTIFFTHVMPNGTQTRRATSIAKQYANGNFKIYGSNCVWSPIPEDRTLARPLNEGRGLSPTLVVELPR
jgi:hypothetical protein